MPLVVSEVNPEALRSIPKGIVANPNCTTMVAMPVLKPLHDEAGLRRVVASTYQAVSGAGLKGVTELEKQAAEAGGRATELTLDGGSAVALPPRGLRRSDRLQRRAPRRRLVDPGGEVEWETDEERKLRDESRKILGLPDLAVSGTCVRVPVYPGTPCR